MRVILVFLGLLLTASASVPRARRPVLHIIDMKAMSFSPAVLDVEPGDTVQWVNTSAGEHNVVFRTLPVKSHYLQKGETFRYVFRTGGTYAYYCQPHRLMGMKGTIRVIQKSSGH